MTINTPDGKNQLHGTAIAMYQLKDHSLPIKRGTDRKKPNDIELYNSFYRSDPNPTNQIYKSYVNRVRD